MQANVWLVIIVLILIVVGSNLLMFGMARGSKNIKLDVFHNMRDSANPWKKEDADFEELNKKIKDLGKKN